MAGARWIRLDVDYFGNPKTLSAGRNGRDLHLASICWVGRFLTDGHIPDDAVAAIGRDAGLSNTQTGVSIDRVVDAGLWIPNGHGFDLHDYVAMNGTRADVERDRAAYLDRQRRYNRKRQRRDDDE